MNTCVDVINRLPILWRRGDFVKMPYDNIFKLLNALTPWPDHVPADNHFDSDDEEELEEENEIEVAEEEEEEPIDYDEYEEDPSEF